jgi:metallo-beta-lactamase family protein
MLSIRFLGAAQTVTGSCFLVENDSQRVLVDCGLVQGQTELTARNRLPFEFDPKALDAVVLTHAHLDHTGLVPRLVAEGFHGRILTTGITKELLPILWEDAVRIQDDSLYTESDVNHAIARCEGHRYGKMVELNASCRVRFSDAGHILGSAIVELWLGGRKIVFSGDLGHRGKPILRDPTIIEAADTLVLESTYGDRNHKALPDTISELGRVIRETQNVGGTVVLPVYAIGRSQDILYVIYQLTSSGVLDKPRVFLDSPMAIRAAEVYGRHIEAFDEEAANLIRKPPKNPRAPQVTFTETVAASRSIGRIRRAIVLAGSGMCEGGRVQDHLARCLPDPDRSVIVTGYQAEGTLGRRLVDGVPRVTIHGKIIDVRAKVHTINGLSAHADQGGLLEWVGAFQAPRPRILLVHGEPEKMAALASALRRCHGIDAAMPKWGERVIL